MRTFAASALLGFTSTRRFAFTDAAGDYFATINRLITDVREADVIVHIRWRKPTIRFDPVARVLGSPAPSPA